MGGTSTQQSNQVQSQQQTQGTTPWAPGAGVLTSLLGNLSGIDPNLSPTAINAIANINNLGGAGNPFQGGVNNVVNSLLGGGGATDQADNVNKAYQQYASQIAPFTNPAYLDPRNTPGFGDALAKTNSDITNQVNSMFAGAGRDLSGLNTKNLVQQLGQGEGGLIANQYNVNAGNQLGAINSLYNAGNTNAGILAGLQQQAVANKLQGIGGAGTAFSMSTAGPLLQLQAESARTGIPLQVLAQQMGIALPSTQAFGQTTGTSFGQGNTAQQNQMSGAQQFALLSGGVKSLLGGPQGGGVLPNTGQ